MRTLWLHLADAIERKCASGEGGVGLKVRLAAFDRQLVESSIDVDLTHISF